MNVTEAMRVMTDLKLYGKYHMYDAEFKGKDTTTKAMSTDHYKFFKGWVAAQLTNSQLLTGEIVAGSRGNVKALELKRVKDGWDIKDVSDEYEES